MPEFVGPVVDKMVEVLKKYTPGELGAGLAEFADFGKQFTGVVQNFPAVWVMPVRTAFDVESQHTRHGLHQVRIVFAVSGPEPDEVTVAAMAYMKAIDAAIAKSEVNRDWEGVLGASGVVQRVWVEEHDYGPLFQKGGVMTRFPEVAVLVEVEEKP